MVLWSLPSSQSEPTLGAASENTHVRVMIALVLSGQRGLKEFFTKLLPQLDSCTYFSLEHFSVSFSQLIC